jgi:hypothetical protein
MLDDKNIEIYSSRDRIRNQLIEHAKNYLKLENFDFNQTSFMSYLIDIISILTANLMYYNTSIYREQFLIKAIQRESILNLSKMIGYTPPLAKPSTCSVLISIPIGDFDNPNENLSIQMMGRSNVPTDENQEIREQIFKVYADSTVFSLKDTIILKKVNNVWTVIQQVILQDDDGSLNPNGWKTLQSRVANGFLEFYADFIQLEDVTETFTIPILQPYEFYDLKFTFKREGFLSDLALFFISTASNDVLEEWTRKESVLLLSSGTPGYAYREMESGVIISFGNGVVGKQPKSNSLCIASAGLTKGFKGNVIAGSIRKSSSIFYLSDDNVTKTILPRVLNRQPAIGGEDPPSADKIRIDAIDSVSMNKRLVSAVDFSNAELVVQDLPIENVYQMMKRSDLKRNEIVLFSDIIYNNVIVPTKNQYIKNIVFETDENVKNYKAGTVVNEDPETLSGDEYLTLFDFTIDKRTKECNYTYVLDSMDTPVILVGTDKEESGLSTNALPIFAKFFTDRTSTPELLHVELHTNVLNRDYTYTCEMTIELDSRDYPSTVVLNKYPNVSSSTSTVDIYTTEAIIDSTGGIMSPLVEIPLDFVKQNEIEVRFKIYYDVSGTDSSSSRTYFNISKSKLIIKKDLTDFMYSQVVETTPGRDEFHSADIDRDFTINLEELNRMIEIYRAGAYHNDTSSIDGFGPGYSADRYEFHSADTNQDWHISLSELLRVIQFYNSEGYRTNPDTEDGFETGTIDEITERTFTIYDIPCVKRDYYLSLINKSDFTKQVLQKITGLDVYSFKMLTDFVNLKFANTTGISRNMKFNKQTKRPVRDINIEEIPTVVGEGYRFAISDDDNPWKAFYDENYLTSSIPNISAYNRSGGFIAEYFENRTINGVFQENGWLFETLDVNDIFEVTNHSGGKSDIYIYNGNNFVIPEFTIPFKIKIVVFTDDSIATSESALRQRIVDILIDKLSPKFGYNKDIYISEIVKYVQSVSGVKSCKVLNPKHDIFINFDPEKDLTQSELIRFTPELIYFGSNNIEIDIKS